MTKKIFEGSARWCTNVSNERGEILQSVLTVSEGRGLEVMCTGLVERYTKFGVLDPVLLYVDRDCCLRSGAGDLKVNCFAIILLCLG